MQSKVRRFRDILATSRQAEQASEPSADPEPGRGEQVRSSGIARP